MGFANPVTNVHCVLQHMYVRTYLLELPYVITRKNIRLHWCGQDATLVPLCQNMGVTHWLHRN